LAENSRSIGVKVAIIDQSRHAALAMDGEFESMRDVLKIASGVFLGMLAFWIVTALLPSLLPASQEQRAAQDLLDRQFAPAH